MEEIRCIKCGRPLRDPDSIARGMGPECAGANGRHSRRYRANVRSHDSSCNSDTSHGSAVTPTLFTVVDEGQHMKEDPLLEEISPYKNAPAEILMQFPPDLIDLVLSAPAAGAIAKHVKNSSKKKKLGGLIRPGRVLQEIRRTCIDLRLTFFPGISTPQGQPIACIPHGEEDWKFENSERVLSRQQLEAYLSRYGMIRSVRM